MGFSVNKMKKISLALGLIFLAACQSAEVANNEAPAIDPMTYAPRRPASIPAELNAKIRFSQDFAFADHFEFHNFVRGGSCTISQAGLRGEKHRISTDQVYGLGFTDGYFYVGAFSRQDNLRATISCVDANNHRLEYMRDYNLRDVLRAMGAVLTK